MTFESVPPSLFSLPAADLTVRACAGAPACAKPGLPAAAAEAAASAEEARFGEGRPDDRRAAVAA